jgi:septal ring factor EnvC (AmiA/AmiB activator)
MTDDEIKEKIDQLQRRWNAVSQDKAGVAGQLQAKKEELAAVVKEIREAGYDPKHIAQERDQAKADLEVMVNKLDAELTEVEKALETFKQK